MRYEKLEDGAMMCVCVCVVMMRKQNNNNLCILVFHSLCIYVWKNRANVDVCVHATIINESSKKSSSICMVCLQNCILYFLCVIAEKNYFRRERERVCEREREKENI